MRRALCIVIVALAACGSEVQVDVRCLTRSDDRLQVCGRDGNCARCYIYYPCPQLDRDGDGCWLATDPMRPGDKNTWFHCAPVPVPAQEGC